MNFVSFHRGFALGIPKAFLDGDVLARSDRVKVHVSPAVPCVHVPETSTGESGPAVDVAAAFASSGSGRLRRIVRRGMKPL